MPNWVSEETNQAGMMIEEIDQFAGPRRRAVKEQILTLKLSDAIPLLAGLAGDPRAVAIRQLYRALGFSEHRQLRWRIEHKLVQALVFNHYCPGVFPVTRGLSAHLRGVGRSRVRQSLQDEFPEGFYIKAALSDSSGDHEICDSTELILASIEAGQDHPIPEHTAITDESLIVQERIPMVKEYRVHSIENHVIEDCTFHRYAGGNIPGERDAPNAYIQSILDQLPNGIIGESSYGWDVGLSPDGNFRAIEANPSGFHPIYKPGFHCSGFYQDIQWGANITARLLRFLENVDRIRVVVKVDIEDHPLLHKFYSDLIYWQGRLKTEP